ncbi:hypothetical protein JBL43_19710 [Aureibaculum sp. A20]|uniref:Lipoprotein n=1 Tax=Aureibaculum flavum TaxID=2795986 RepID=A0ABS0WWW1_9FLAO|nr:hypothetical protein [Aureibaculum flavum]MBJ2176487.1 hypothetical protein [Aureibaculum flavum]
MKIISIFIITLIIVSCSDIKETELIERADQLELENKELKEEIEKLHANDIINTIMVPSFDKEEYSQNGKGKITFKAHKYYDFNFPITSMTC